MKEFRVTMNTLNVIVIDADIAITVIDGSLSFRKLGAFETTAFSTEVMVIAPGMWQMYSVKEKEVEVRPIKSVT